MTVDTYIKTFPKDTQAILQKVRQTIKSTAPDAEEIMNYGAPGFRQNGKEILYATFKHHLGLYPTPAMIIKFKKELFNYKTSKGAIQFPLNKPIPYALIKKITQAHLNQ